MGQSRNRTRQLKRRYHCIGIWARWSHVQRFNTRILRKPLHNEWRWPVGSNKLHERDPIEQIAPVQMCFHLGRACVLFSWCTILVFGSAIDYRMDYHLIHFKNALSSHYVNCSFVIRISNFISDSRTKFGAQLLEFMLWSANGWLLKFTEALGLLQIPF